MNSLPAGFELPTGSQVARGVRAINAVSVVVAVVGGIWLSQRSLGWALVFVALVLGLTPLVLGLQHALLAWVSAGAAGRDMAKVVGANHPPQAASAQELLASWWQESQVTVRMFGHDMARQWATEPNFPGPVASGKRGVVLIHGFCCNRGLWRAALQRLARDGIPHIAVSLEPVFGDIDGYAARVDSAVQALVTQTGRMPVLVGHSMGGLVARAWLRTATPQQRLAVERVITIGSPHHGTWLGQFSHATNGQQMRLQSRWLQQLAADEGSRGEDFSRFVCFYSACDNIVFPAGSATLPGADNRHIPGTPHLALAEHGAVIQTVVDFALPRVPQEGAEGR